jgi:hypothetical protein
VTVFGLQRLCPQRSVLAAPRATFTMRFWPRFWLPRRYQNVTDVEFGQKNHCSAIEFRHADESRDRRSTVRGILFLLALDVSTVLSLFLALRPLITLWRNNSTFFSPSLALGKPSASEHPANHSKIIPPILHQTCANESIPEMWKASQQSCRETYSDFQYMVRKDGETPL